LWLVEAAAAGTTRMRVKMADAVTTAKLAGSVTVDWALGHAAVHARFAEADLASILAHHAGRSHQAGVVGRTGASGRGGGQPAQGTAGWATLGRPQPELEAEVAS
jgi:hypothetical protein